MKVLLSWLRDFVDVPHARGHRGDDVGARLRRRRHSNGWPTVTPSSTSRSPPTVPTACRSAASRARWPPRTACRCAGRLVARRAAAGDAALQLTSLKTVDGDIDIVIENPDLCPRYAGAVADVTIGPSPDWMQSRLRAAGVRPISNVVDVTNYVLLELGQPMHAFDLDAHRRRARSACGRARPGETHARRSTADSASCRRRCWSLPMPSAPIAVAGVMGGGDSEVTQRHQDHRLRERATSMPLSVRRTSKALGLKTEASMRFERGTDPRLPLTAMERACALLETIGGGHGARHGGRPLPRPHRAAHAAAAARPHRRTARGRRFPMPMFAASSRRLVSRCARRRRRLGRHRPDAPRRRHCAKSTSSKKSRATTGSIGFRPRSRR